MPASAAIIARDQRILAGHAAGATILDLALAEEVDPAVVRRVLRAAGIEPGTIRAAPDPHVPDCLSDPGWLRAEYATKGAKQIAKELGCAHHLVYDALHAAGIPVRPNGVHVVARSEIPPDQAERAVSLYLAGWSAERIGAELGVSAKRIGELVEQRGIKRTRSEVTAMSNAERRESWAGRRDEWPAELEAEVLDRYARGQSGETISDLLELPASSVYRLLRERGVLRSRGARRVRPRAQAEAKPRPRGAPRERKLQELLPAELAAEAEARYAVGEASGAIAALFGLPRDRVHRFLEQRGVLRSRSEAVKLRRAKWRALEQARIEARKRRQVEASGQDRGSGSWSGMWSVLTQRRARRSPTVTVQRSRVLSDLDASLVRLLTACFTNKLIGPVLLVLSERVPAKVIHRILVET